MLSENMVSERIISDYFWKFGSVLRLLPKEHQYTKEMVQKIEAVHRMYGWLYQQKILSEVSFMYKDYEAVVYFALDVAEIKNYRTAMESSGLEDAELACQLIFDTECTFCRFSGAIQFIEPMDTFREVDGVVSRSWECLLIQHLSYKAAYDVLHIRQEKGTKAAVMAMYKKLHWASCK